MSDAGSLDSGSTRPSTSHLYIDPHGAEIIDLNLIGMIPSSPKTARPENITRTSQPVPVLKRERSNDKLYVLNDVRKQKEEQAANLIRNQNIENEDEDEEFQGYDEDRTPTYESREMRDQPTPIASNSTYEADETDGGNSKSTLFSVNSARTHDLMRFKPFDQSEDLTNPAYKKSRLHRIFSESETSNFDPVNGKRLYNDDKYRKFRTIHLQNQQNQQIQQTPQIQRSTTPQNNHTIMRSNTLRTLSQAPFDTEMNLKIKRYTKEHQDPYDTDTGPSVGDNKPFTTDIIPDFNGMEDEYIADLDFTHVLQKWESNKDDDNLDVSTVSFQVRPLTPIGLSHAQVAPVAVPMANNQSVKTITNDNDDLAPTPDSMYGSLHISLKDPTLTHEEELVMQTLPPDFRDLPFTARRRLIRELSPKVNEAVIHNVIKKRFKKRSVSVANSYLASFSDRSKGTLKETDCGFVVMQHKLGRVIGNGAWGLVRECTGPNGEERAMKITKADSDEKKRFFKKETDIWGQLDHPHILKLINVMVGKGAIFCLTEKIKHGTLYDIASRWGPYNDPKSGVSQEERLIISRNYLLQLAHALSYMHKRGFVHGDVKLENCLIQGSKLLLADFGMSVRYTPIDLLAEDQLSRRPSFVRSSSDNGSEFEMSAIQRITTDSRLVHDDTRLNLPPTPTRRTPPEFVPQRFEPATEEEPVTQRLLKFPSDETLPHSHIGSLPYASPELLEANPVPLGPSADIWAFGVTLYTMIVGRLPFNSTFEPKLKLLISTGSYDIESLKDACIVRNGNRSRLCDVVTGCMTVNMTKRLTLDQLLALLKAS